MSAGTVVATVPARLRSWLLDDRRSSYGLAIMRIGFGGMTLAILALYLPHFSYTFGEGARWGEALQLSSSVHRFPWPITEIFSRTDSDTVLAIKVAVLAAVSVLYVLGWRMRVVSPLFVILWLSFSTLNPVITNTGHYQTFRVLLILMLFADLSRRWSLDARRRRRKGEPEPLTLGGVRISPPGWLVSLLNNAAVVLIGFQLCLIYVVSAIWKLQGRTWASGVAVYYPLRVEELTLLPWLNELVWNITPAVFVGSWLAVYLQLVFPLLLLNRWSRLVAIIGVTGMHAAIGVLLAIPFFSIVMICADMIFVRDRTWRAMSGWLGERTRALWARLTRGRGEPEPDASEPEPDASEPEPDERKPKPKREPEPKGSEAAPV